MPLTPNELLSPLQFKSEREKTDEVELLAPTNQAVPSVWLKCDAYQYKGVHIYGTADLAGLNLDIEIANNPNFPVAKYTAIASSDFKQVNETCTYIRVNVKAITTGKVGVMVRGMQEG